MNRVSSNMSRLDAQYHMMMREWQMNELQNKIGMQSKIKNLRDDPIAAAHSTRYQSKLVRLERYARNIGDVKAGLSDAEVKVRDTVDRLQRIRELAVQGANGIYTKQDMAAMGKEVDELLEELVSIGNSRNGLGNTIFGGFESKNEPFRVLRGKVEGGERDHIVEVQYRGDIGRNIVEVSEESLAEMNIPGNYVFWAENQSIYSSLDSRTYQVQANSAIRIDGVDIPLKEGDNIYAVISKINDAPVAVKASLDPVKDSLVLQTTTPHEMWLEDSGGSTVLQDLGLIRGGTNQLGNAYSTSANVYGGSVFDAVISLRDSLYSGSTDGVNRAIGGMDESLQTLTSHLAEIGAVNERIEGTGKRLDYEIPLITEKNSNEVDLDLAQAATDLKMLEYTHQAALATAAKILPPTLLDFLR
ncbi:MAG: flagellar hook-associated protein 3 [Spirochaetales bacterium]|nr:flagellar hook-associated protein 3 [Spirochaetales bacterium]